jgi:pimeloyl-ACP methyl ester carboxylesterase
VVIGRSLGSGVAVHVAAERKPAGVVLVTPFDSLRAVAQGIYPFVPVSLLLRHPFDSLALAPSIAAPMLALVATQDRVIAPAHARRLFEAWRGP